MRQVVFAFVWVFVSYFSPATAQEPSAPLSTLDANFAGTFTAEKISLIHRDDVKNIPVSIIARINVDALGAMSEEQVRAMTDAQVEQLTDEQRRTLDQHLKKRYSYLKKKKQKGEIRRRGAAMEPGIKLQGDAYSQLTKSDGEGLQAKGSLGAGLEMVTRKVASDYFCPQGNSTNGLERSGCVWQLNAHSAK